MTGSARHDDLPANSCPHNPVSCLPARLRRKAQRTCDPDLTLAIATAADDIRCSSDVDLIIPQREARTAHGYCQVKRA